MGFARDLVRKKKTPTPPQGSTLPKTPDPHVPKGHGGYPAGLRIQKFIEAHHPFRLQRTGLQTRGHLFGRTGRQERALGHGHRP